MYIRTSSRLVRSFPILCTMLNFLSTRPCPIPLGSPHFSSFLGHTQTSTSSAVLSFRGGASFLRTRRPHPTGGVGVWGNQFKYSKFWEVLTSKRLKLLLRDETNSCESLFSKRTTNCQTQSPIHSPTIDFDLAAIPQQAHPSIPNQTSTWINKWTSNFAPQPHLGPRWRKYNFVTSYFLEFLPSSIKHTLPIIRMQHNIYIYGQITIIPKPELRALLGDSLTKLPFGVTSAEVAIICPDIYIYVYIYTVKTVYIYMYICMGGVDHWHHWHGHGIIFFNQGLWQNHLRWSKVQLLCSFFGFRRVELKGLCHDGLLWPPRKKKKVTFWRFMKL